MLRRIVLLVLTTSSLLACSDEPEDKFCAGAGIAGAPIRATREQAVHAFLDATEDTEYEIAGHGEFGYVIEGHTGFSSIAVSRTEGGFTASSSCAASPLDQ